MLSHSEEEPILTVERRICNLLHDEHSMTVFSKLYKAISFRIKHKGERLYYFFNHKNNSDLETINWINNPLCIRMLEDTSHTHDIFTHHMSELLFHGTRESKSPAHMQINSANTHSGTH